MKCRLAVSLDAGWEGEVQGAFRVLSGRHEEQDPLFALSLVPTPDSRSSSAPASVLTWAGWETQVSCSAAAGSASLLISGSRGCVLAAGGMCRAVGSRSSAGSLNHVPPTLCLSRALIPGLYFLLIDYLCHCGADILRRSPAWSVIMGAWGMIIPQQHPLITVNNSREGRQTIVGTCLTEVLLFLGQDTSAEEEESLEGGRGGPCRCWCSLGLSSWRETLAKDGQSWKGKKRGGEGMKWKELRAALKSIQTAWWPLVHKGWRKQTVIDYVDHLGDHLLDFSRPGRYSELFIPNCMESHVVWVSARLFYEVVVSLFKKVQVEAGIFLFYSSLCCFLH